MDNGDVSYEVKGLENDAKYKVLATVIYSKTAKNIPNIVYFYTGTLYRSIEELNAKDSVKIQIIAADDTNDIHT